MREHIAWIFAGWPDLTFATRRLYVREDLVVQEWTARATHARSCAAGDIVAPPTGKRIEWVGMDVIPFEDGLITRKDVYSDSVSILRQVGLLEGLSASEGVLRGARSRPAGRPNRGSPRRRRSAASDAAGSRSPPARTGRGA